MEQCTHAHTLRSTNTHSLAVSHSLALQRADNAVEHLLERYQVSSARQVVAKAPLKPLAPVRGTGRRTCAPTQFPRHASDISTIISTDPSSAASTAPQTQLHGSPTHRKRKRRVESKRLAADVDAPARVKPSSDTMCPVRIDLDVNGTRFQDTLLLNAYVPSPSLYVLRMDRRD